MATSAALIRFGWLANDDDLSDQSHDNLMRYAREQKAIIDLLLIGEAERQEAARLARRAAHSVAVAGRGNT